MTEELLGRGLRQPALVASLPEPASGLGPTGDDPARGALHFVWFRGEEYTRACRVFGKPDFIHMGWDRRARREIDFDNDLILFARGEHDQPFAPRNFNDILEAGQ